MKRERFEVLAPAGSMEILKAVLEAGADAVYVGGQRFGARAYANNFSDEELLAAIDYVHLHEKKLYLTVNTLMKNRELPELIQYLNPFYQQGLDAVIVQDMGALKAIHRAYPDLDIHASTQMTITGVEGARLLYELGATRVVTARELSIKEIASIHKEVPVEIETFVHGALCYCYSGQCLFSSVLGGRSGNRGRCAQPCRLPYSLQTENGEVMSKEAYLLSLKDNCGIELLPKLYDAGVYSLKIEGRMKQKEYAAGVVAKYCSYIKRLCETDGDTRFTDDEMKHLLGLGNRCGFTKEYFRSHNGNGDMITYSKPSHEKSITLDETYEPKHLPVWGHVYAKVGEPLTFTIWNEDNSMSLAGDIVQEAMKRPLVEADYEKAMGKLGDDVFEMEALTCEIVGNGFLPIGALKELRRKTFANFKENLICRYRRKMVELKQEDVKPHAISSKEQLICSLEDREVLSEVIKDKNVTDIYMDMMNYDASFDRSLMQRDFSLIQESGKDGYVMLPYIFREHTRMNYDRQIEAFHSLPFKGFIIRNYEELIWVREHFPHKAWICDHNLYCYNDISSNAFLDMGAQAVTMPFELNRGEIQKRDNSYTQMMIYGRYPLMISAQCLRKNTKGCTHTPGKLKLVDRYKKVFPVRNLCGTCENIIYNSLPTSLLDQKSELTKMGLHAFRLHFTFETKEQVHNLLDNYCLERNPDIETTKGHFKRGVE